MLKNKKFPQYLWNIFLVFSLLFCLTACTGKSDGGANVNNETGETYEYDVPSITSFEYKDNAIRIKWDKIDGIENYRVFRKDEQSDWEILGDSQENGFTDENAEKEKTYSYTVRCLDPEGLNYLSGYDDIGKSILNVAYDIPDLSEVKRVNDGIEIKWKAVDGINNYMVMRKVEDGKWKKLESVEGNKYVDKDVKNGKTYSYSVRCVNEDSTILGNFDRDGLKLKYVLLKTPQITNVENVDGGIKITWDAVSKAEKYRVFHKVGDGKWEKVLDTKSTECIDEGVTEGTAYTYTVRCLSEDGESYMSEYDKNGVTITYLK